MAENVNIINNLLCSDTISDGQKLYNILERKMYIMQRNKSIVQYSNSLEYVLIDRVLNRISNNKKLPEWYLSIISPNVYKFTISTFRTTNGIMKEIIFHECTADLIGIRICMIGCGVKKKTIEELFS